METIGILNSGGDCPGLNAVICGATRAAQIQGWRVLGFTDGFEGLLPEGGDYVVLDGASTAGILPLGGTILGITNRGHFRTKGRGLSAETLNAARKTYDTLGLRALVVIGGDGSMGTALHLAEVGFNIVAVPKTIDNDLDATARTFGFDSAVQCVTDSLDRLHTTTTSHRRVMIVEVMGRNAGWIALHGGLAGGADIILLPEIPYDNEKIIETIKARDEAGRKSTMIVVAEGAMPLHGRPQRRVTADGENRLGGIADTLARAITSHVPQDVRTCVLGHLQRGGNPTALDRILGAGFGVHAVELIAEERYDMMVNYINNRFSSVPISHAVHKARRVSPQSDLVRIARIMGVSFGD